MLLVKEREQLVAFGKKLITSDLTTGSGGNISIFNRDEGLIAITRAEWIISKPKWTTYWL